MITRTVRFWTLSFLLFLFSCGGIFAQQITSDKGRLVVSENGRFLCHEDGRPFFWLGDTGWSLGLNLDRKEAEHYLNVRKDQGFNVVQMMLMWQFPVVNTYGRCAFIDSDPLKVVDGEEEGIYTYWDHIDYIVERAARRGIYIAMLPTWGNLVRKGLFDKKEAAAYARFLALRYRDQPNIIWVNGGDVHGSIKPEIWHTIGETIKKHDPNHLMTFHPRGGRSSIDWFHDASWLDFNMFQSGHWPAGQNNIWRFVQEGLEMTPPKPILDGEPVYEDIPQKLRAGEPRWTDSDARRAAYTSVFSGSFGHTYGNNAVMLMHKPGYRELYYNKRYWYDAVYDPGARQMKYVKELMLKFPFFDRVPDQSLIAGDIGEKEDRIVATRGRDYLLAYVYNGRDLQIDITKISGDTKRVWWMNPKTGKYTYTGTVPNGIRTFSPSGATRKGKDWVLVVTDSDASFDLN